MVLPPAFPSQIHRNCSCTSPDSHNLSHLTLLTSSPPDLLEKAAKVEEMFFRVLTETPVINQGYAKRIAQFFGAHLAVHGSDVGDPKVRLLDIDGITGIDGTAMYLLFRWPNGLVTSAAVVKVSHSTHIDPNLNIVIRSAPNVGTADGQTRIEWFLWRPTIDSDPVKDILIAGGKELGLVSSEYFGAIMFHKLYHSLNSNN